MPEHSITWLHFSDLHFCNPTTGWDAALVQEKLLEDLGRMQRDHNLHPDLVFFTGDTAFGHLGDGPGKSIEDQFNQAEQLFEQVRQSFAPAVDQDRFFLVPGNHDVHRGKVPAAQTAYLDGLLSKPEEGVDTVTKMIQSDSVDWRAYMQRLEDYRQFLERAGYDHLLSDPQRLLYGTRRTIRGIEVGVAGLNSAWSCCRDQEKSKLWLGGHWQIQTVRPQLQNAHITIGLIHHPINWLAEAEDPKLGPELSRTFRFLLHGHEHQSWVNSDESHVRIAAAAAYERADSDRNGYNLVRLDLANQTAEVWLRRYDHEGGGWVPRAIHNKTDNDGCWRLENLSWLSPPPSTAAPTAPSTVASTVASSDETDAVEPPVAVPELTGPESRGVFGREQDIAKLAKLVDRKPLSVVYGLAGIGKTKVVEELLHTAEHSGRKHRMVRAAKERTAVDLYRELAAELGDRREQPRPPLGILGQPADFSVLAKYGKNSDPYVIHVDQAHHLFDDRGFHDDEVRELLQQIARHASHVRLVLECREAPPPGLFPDDLCGKVKIAGLDCAALTAFFRRPFRERPASGWTLDDATANLVHRRLGGSERGGQAHPLAMFLLAEVADHHGQRPEEVLQRHPETLVRELEENLFGDLYEHVLNDPERRVLQLCSLYRDGIPDQHVDRLNARARNGQADDRDYFRHLIARCLLTPDDGEQWYYLHALIGELTQSRIKTGNAEFIENHECIADAWLAQVGGSTRPSLPNIRAASEAVHHLIQAQRYDRLPQLGRRMLRDDTKRYLEGLSQQLHRKDRHREDRYVLELLVGLDENNHKAHRFLGEAIERIEGRGYQKALDHFLTAHRLNPQYPQYLANLGRCMLARKEPEQFIELVENLEDTVREGAVNDHVQSILSDCLSSMGDVAGASQLRRKYIDSGSRHPTFYADEAKYLQQQDQPAEALELLDRAERLGIADEITQSIRAGILQQQGDGPAASRLRRKYIDSGSRNPAFYHDEAKYLQQQDRPVEALELLDRAERLGIADEYTQSIRAGILQQQGDAPAASRLRRKYIESGSRDPAFYHDEVKYLQQQDRPAEALELLDRVDQMGIADEYTKNLRAGILKQQDDGPAASQQRQKQIDEGTTEAAVFQREAKYQLKLGNPQRALEVLDQAADRNAVNKPMLVLRAKAARMAKSE